jgi:radical SAM superfamily enzyme YgiQ (UPF0313 family)
VKVLLIHPHSKALGFGDMIRAEPLGLESIAGNLRGHLVKILDLRIEGKRGLEEALSSFRPEVVGISCLWTCDHVRVQELAFFIKKKLPKSFLLIGGVHASLCYEQFKEPIDAVIVGEGEDTLRELLEAIESGKDGPLPGVFRPSDPKNFRLRGFIENLDELPFPLRVRYKGVGYHLGFQRPLGLVEASRGCPFRCSFCAVWPFFKGTYRGKSPERVVEELLNLSDPFVLFVDDNFLADPERSMEIAFLIRRKGLKKYYTFQARSDSIVKHKDLLKLWKEIGLKAVFVGFEGISDEELLRLNKRLRVSTNDQAIKVLEELGVDLWASFIVEPSFNLEAFKNLRTYVRSRSIKNASFSVLTPLPGTRLFEELKDKVISNNYELFDIAHSVLPTALSLEKFYEEFCSLYQEVYSAGDLIKEGFRAWIKGFPLKGLLKMLLSAKRLSSPSFYLKAHDLNALRSLSFPSPDRAS